MNRRKALETAGMMAATAAWLPQPTLKANGDEAHPFSFCLNTSTIMGQKLGIEAEIKLAAEAGYDGIEIWIRSLDAYLEGGGKLADLKQMAADLGIRIENAIGFAKWIVDDEKTRQAALEQARREMDMLNQVGCTRIAAPPAGATEKSGLDLDAAGARFHELMVVGKEMGVIPQLEVWGFSKNLHKLSQVLYVAAEAGHPDTRILPDIYHLYKGGSDFDGLKLMDGNSIEIFHVNDYPDTPGRDEIADKDRVYPGDGVGPVTQVLQDLFTKSSPVVLSLELFNQDLWAQAAAEVATTGLAKMKAAVAQALE